MAADGQRTARLEDQTKAAERFLVLRNFEEADRISRYVLQQALYVPGSTSEQQRAAYVFLQALFELQRFAESFAALEQHYGSLTGIDQDVLMLWAALALDAGMQLEAAATLRSYLHGLSLQDVQRSKTQSSKAAPSQQQLLVAARMYAVEVLAREGRQCSDAVTWLHSSPAQELLSAEDRDSLLCELRQLQQAAEGAPMRPETPSNAPERRPQQQRMGRPGKAAAASREAQPAGAVPEQQAAKAFVGPKDGASSSAAASAPPAARASMPAASAAADLLQSGGSAAASSRSAEGRDAAGGSSLWSLCWPAGLQQHAVEWWRRAQGWAALEGVSQGQAAAAALGTAVLLYAAFAERRALALGARRLGGSVLGSVYEVARLATTLSPNPVAAAMATQR